MNAGLPGPSTAHTSSRSAILDVIRAAGTISRVELTHSTGLTAATISTVVRRLIDEGLVVEAGRAESTGGKPRMLLRLDPAARYAVCDDHCQRCNGAADQDLVPHSSPPRSDEPARPSEGIARVPSPASAQVSCLRAPGSSL